MSNTAQFKKENLESLIMRLTKDQINAFVETLSEYKFCGELRLYGSRADDNARGGDIDLILIVEQATDQHRLNDTKYKILTQFKNRIGDQKIDLLITTFDKAKNDPFVQHLLPDSKLIYSWRMVC